MERPTREITGAEVLAIFSRSLAFPSRICLALSSFPVFNSSSCSKIRSKPFSISSMGLFSPGLIPESLPGTYTLRLSHGTAQECPENGGNGTTLFGLHSPEAEPPVHLRLPDEVTQAPPESLLTMPS